MIGRWIADWRARRAMARLRRWNAYRDALYRAQRARQRAVYAAWLAERELPGSPVTPFVRDAVSELMQ